MIRSRPFLIVEFLLLCIAVPGYIILSRSAPFMFTFLWGATLYCFLILRFFYFKDWNDLWRWDQVTWTHMKPILARWILGVIGMTAFLYFYNPSAMFALWRRNPEIIPWILFMYPVISALPQEFIFCSFFFRRYEPFFGGGKVMILASAVVFAYCHILYINPVAPVLSLAGGIIFAMTYHRHKSLALVTIEHVLYGNALFLIGLGQYFYSGGVSR
jgi:membrane protease YdiL (CAAX protease family)